MVLFVLFDFGFFAGGLFVVLESPGQVLEDVSARGQEGKNGFPGGEAAAAKVGV